MAKRGERLTPQQERGVSFFSPKMISADLPRLAPYSAPKAHIIKPGGALGGHGGIVLGLPGSTAFREIGDRRSYPIDKHPDTIYIIFISHIYTYEHYSCASSGRDGIVIVISRVV